MDMISETVTFRGINYDLEIMQILRLGFFKS